MSQTLSYSSVVETGTYWSNGANVQTKNGVYATCHPGGDAPITATSGWLKIALTNPTDPQDHNDHIVLVTAKRSSETVVSAGTVSIEVSLRESGTERDNFTIAPTTSDADYPNTLSTTEASNISNYNNLEVWVRVSFVAGTTGNRTVYIDFEKMTIPDLAVPAQVTGVAASDGTYTDKVRVSWNTAARADDYNIYRHTSNNSGSATKIKDGDTASPYDDTTAVSGTTYYYWVRGSNASGEGAFSSSNTGYALAAPGIPTGVDATDGTFTTKTQVTWNSVATATSYRVFRHTSDVFGSATQIASGVATTSYDDTTGLNDTVYFYWVKAVNAVGESSESTSDSGHRLELPAAPTDVAATDGDFTDKVTVTWTEPSAADSYKIYRNTVDSIPASSLVSGVTGATYDDTTAVQETTYYYWVKATNTAGDSAASDSDSGYASAGGLTIATDPMIATATMDIGSVSLPQPNRTWRDVFVSYSPSSEMLHVGQIQMSHSLVPGDATESDVSFDHFTYELGPRALHHFVYEETFPSAFISVSGFTTSERGGAHQDRPDSVIFGFWSWGSHPSFDRYPPALLYEASIPAEESTVPQTAAYPSYGESSPPEDCWAIIPASDFGQPEVHKELRRVILWLIPPPDETKTSTVEVFFVPHPLNAQGNAAEQISESVSVLGYNAAAISPVQATKVVYVDFDPLEASGEAFEIKIKLTGGVGIRRVALWIDVGGEPDTLDYQAG